MCKFVSLDFPATVTGVTQIPKIVDSRSTARARETLAAAMARPPAGVRDQHIKWRILVGHHDSQVEFDVLTAVCALLLIYIILCDISLRVYYRLHLEPRTTLIL